MENSIMDIMIRYQRMNGKKTLLLPGTDHAAIATQAKVERILIEEKGIKNPREELGREKLLDEIREYAENSKTTILSQIRKMGTSCDWSRLAYTFDDTRSHAVNTVFTKMYEDGLIYRGHRVINWSVKGQSTCSDDELEHVERPAKLYTFKYSADFPITIATTRPETKLGDTAVAVNPTDKRYQKFIGKTFTVDVGAKKPLEIKIIADTEVDKDFGTGALGVTPAHSPIDFAMYEKQKAENNAIGFIQVIDKHGKMTAEAGSDYQSLSVEDAREKFVNYLKENNLLEKEEDITQNVGTSDRFKDVVEAIPMTQWFIDVNKKIPEKDKSLKELMQEAVRTGHNDDIAQKINITPERFEETYFSWIDNLRDWCISRQVWWGHQIPVWYKEDEIFVGIKAPSDEGWEQDPDTLDTWFSSGLWTFSTLGWPEKTPDFKTFHPTNWMQMGRDILFFWMARMILMTVYTLDEIPFKDVYIHGMLSDKNGNKFSKSAGNTMDPIDVVNEYGADALRLSCVTGIAPGNDLKIYTEKIENSRNFTTKLWNIGRYITNATKDDTPFTKNTPLSASDKWILTKLQETVTNVTKDIKEYNFSHASESLKSFTRDDFADWYVEIHKVEKNDAVLVHIYKTLLKLWHPFIPFITETIWQEMFDKDQLLMMTKYPTVQEYDKELEATNNFETIKKIITHIRNIRAVYTVPATAEINITIITKHAENITTQENLIKKLARVNKISIQKDDVSQTESASAVFANIKLYVHLSGIIDIEKEKKRLEDDITQTKKYTEGIQGRLNSEQFTKKAPENIVQQERDNLTQAETKITELSQHLTNLTN
ncbi:MAG: valine--tRNA ligase, partial [Patescibacteria group bacterium]|nr:valine--tRNA ligase [Patescibacteria group bacterium]